MNIFSLFGAVGLSVAFGLQPKYVVNPSNVTMDYSYGTYSGELTLNSNYSFDALKTYISDNLGGYDDCFYATVHCVVIPQNSIFSASTRLSIECRGFDSSSGLTRYFNLANQSMNNFNACFGFIDIFSGATETDGPTYYDGSLTRYYFTNMPLYSLKVSDYFLDENDCRFAYADNYSATHLFENDDSDYSFISNVFSNVNDEVYGRMASYNERIFGLNKNALVGSTSHGAWCQYFNCYSYCVRTVISIPVGNLSNLSTSTVFEFNTITNEDAVTSYNNGYNVGYVNGESVGYDNGYDDGYDGGYDVGYDNGYTQGYDTGKTDGIATSNDYTFLGLFGAVADTPVIMIRSLFDFDFFGINLLSVILSLFTGVILFYLLRKLL